MQNLAITVLIAMLGNTINKMGQMNVVGWVVGHGFGTSRLCLWFLLAMVGFRRWGRLG